MSDEPEISLSFQSSGEYDVLKPNFDFIENMLRDASVAIIYGPPQSGKTFFALHLLCSTALGRSVFGLKVDKRPSLYVALEGEAGIKTRIQAWCAEHHVRENPIHYALGSMNLFYESHQDVLIAEIRKRKVRFVVVDTLSMASTGMDENSAQSMSHIISALHRIKDETGACVVAIHHTGKDVKAGMRGHSSLLGNVDTTIEIVADTPKAARGRKAEAELTDEPITTATPRRARVRKQRDGEAGVTFHFSLAIHETPTMSARGEPIRSVAVCESDFPDFEAEEAEAPRPRRLTAREQEAQRILDRQSRIAPPTVEQFQRALKRAHWGPKNAATWRSAFRELKAKLELDSNDAVVAIY